jgi:hypothetical protein
MLPEATRRKVVKAVDITRRAPVNVGNYQPSAGHTETQILVVVRV